MVVTAWKPGEVDVQRWSLEELRCGDVLLSQGRFQLSRWMAWNAGCPYSHAALVLDGGGYVEARPPRIRRRPLTDLVAWRERLRFVDVWRPLNPDGSELSGTQRSQLARLAGRWLGWPFAGNRRMAWLALQTLLRHPGGAPRWRLPVPPDGGVSCTEFVYRMLLVVAGDDLLVGRELGVVQLDRERGVAAAHRGGPGWRFHDRVAGCHRR
jgi:hypothetical protein